jgi:sigma-E factor negative regulatory protein RseC
MIEEQGQVVEVQGEFAWIEGERTTTCGSCAVRKGCGTSAIAKLLGQRRVRLRALNRIDAHVGDHVVIGIAESGLLRGSLAVYAVPLLGLFAGALAGQLLGGALFASPSDLLAIAGAIGGFVAALAWLKRFSRHNEKDAAYQPVVLRQQIRTGAAVTWSERAT